MLADTFSSDVSLKSLEDVGCDNARKQKDLVAGLFSLQQGDPRLAQPERFGKKLPALLVCCTANWWRLNTNSETSFGNPQNFAF